jgi:hypothetical protein
MRSRSAMMRSTISSVARGTVSRHIRFGCGYARPDPCLDGRSRELVQEIKSGRIALRISRPSAPVVRELHEFR